MKQFILAAIVALFAGLAPECFSQTAAPEQNSAQPDVQQPAIDAVTEADKAADNAVSLDVVKGTVKEIAEDKTFILVDGAKILTTKEFLEDSYLEVGDKIEVSVDKSGEGLRAKSYNYIFEEESLPVDTEEAVAGEEAPAEK